MTLGTRHAIRSVLVAGVLALVISARAECPCSIWASTDTPSVPTYHGHLPDELGLKFRADVPGFVTGVRFYKGPGNISTHVGHLWSSTGALLAEAEFTNETDSGWQQVSFPSPVPIAANTTYIISFHSSLSYFAVDTGYFTVGHDNPPLHALADGEDGPNGVYGVDPNAIFPTSTYDASNYWVDVVFATGPDNTPPTVTSVTPADGATGASTQTSVTAYFSEPLSAATVSGTNFELRDNTGALVPANVSYATGPNAAVLVPTNPLAFSTTYTARVVGGAAGITDIAGNALVSDFTWSFTTGTGTSYRIWDDSATPYYPALTDDVAIEVGVKFRADVAGLITGVRFYKGAANTGLHVGHLWSGTGTLLAEAVFAGESGSGWQAVDFPAPVAITANTTYVASYHSATGYFADTIGYFASRGMDSPPLHALASGVDGTNGVYTYSDVAAFPTVSYNDSNYWVDVAFTAGADTTPPTVVTVSPTSGASVFVGTTVTGAFSKALDASTVNGATFQLRDGTGALVAASVSYNVGSNAALLVPTNPLAVSTAYTARLVGGAAGIKDTAGHPLATDYTWTFTTSADASAPTVVAVLPTSGAAGVPTGTSLTATFSRALDAATVSGSTFELRRNAGALVAATVSYDAGTNAAILVPTSALAFSTTYTAQLTGGATGIKDPAGFPLASEYSWSFTTGADVSPPTVIAVSPTSGAAGVFIGTSVTATFSKALNAATVSTATFELRDGTGALVAASVSYNSGATAAVLAPASYLTASTTYTARVVGGAGGVTDAAGHALAADYTWSFTTSGTGPYSIWDGTATPVYAALTHGNPIEVGVKFRADVDGFISGLRFYKGAANGGQHIAHLWSRTGTLLAEATFTGESSSGWQNVAFATPVPITANTNYVASYHSSSGYFADSLGYFASGVDNPPLHALADGVDGANGVYVYSANTAFPTRTYNAGNYWVDVLFTTGPDASAPTVTAVAPAASTTGVFVATSVTGTFSKALAASTVSSATFELRDNTGTLVPATVSYDGANNAAVLRPASALTPSTSYTARLKGGAGNITDTAGHPLATDYTWSFTTGLNGPYHIWDPSATPALPAVTDGIPNEVGVKFRADVDGVLTGVRFYKGLANTGQHVGHLWSRTGTLLAEAVFNNETASGWQEALFAAPVAITANTTYIASYHSSSGYTADTMGYFVSDIHNPPLRALASGVDGPNGVYAYDPNAVFPSLTYNASNYWVDVVFATGVATPNPTVTAVTPASAATGVNVETTVTAAFSQALDASTVTGATFQLRDGNGVLVSATVSYDASAAAATLVPTVLGHGVTYTATVKGGAAGVRDVVGHALAADYAWSFTTAAATPAPFAGWQYVTTLTDANATVVADYVVQVSLTAGNFNFAHAQPDGRDVRFYDATDEVQVPWWIQAWDANAQTATVWVRVRNMAHHLRMYYGNPAAAAFDIPPLGPFENYGTGQPIINTSGLAENIVQDPNTGRYWLVYGTLDTLTINLCYSDDLLTWTDYGLAYSTPGLNNGTPSPCLVYSSGAWYLVYATTMSGQWQIRIASAPAVTGPYADVPAVNPLLAAGPASWESERVLEPFVFWDGNLWRLLYMGDSGNTTEQIGQATAPAITGPYTKDPNNPIIRFGPADTFDAGTIADPGAMQVGSTWYITYASGPQKVPPWSTALTTTADFRSFARNGTLLAPGNKGNWDDGNALRGTLFRAGDYYYLPYSASSVGGQPFHFAVTRQYAKSTAAGYPPDQVFDFYDDMSVPRRHLRLDTGSTGGSMSVSGGVLTVGSGRGTYGMVYSDRRFGPGMLMEAYTQRPNADGSLNRAGETGLFQLQPTLRGGRIYDYGSPLYQAQAALNSVGTNTQLTTAVAKTWQTESVWFESTSSLRFAVNASGWQQVTSNAPDGDLPVFLMSYATSGNTNNLKVDWLRVRRYQLTEPSITVGAESANGS